MPSKWFERSFPGGYPIDLFPNLISRLRGAPVRARAETAGLSEAQARSAPGETWSIQRNVGHLIDLEELWLRRLDDYDRQSEILAAADLENRRTHEAGHDSLALEQVLAGFESIRRQFLARIENWTNADMRRVARHPRLDQPMRALDLLHFVAEHDDHHLARIWELRREL